MNIEDQFLAPCAHCAPRKIGVVSANTDLAVCDQCRLKFRKAVEQWAGTKNIEPDLYLNRYISPGLRYVILEAPRGLPQRKFTAAELLINIQQMLTGIKK